MGRRITMALILMTSIAIVAFFIPAALALRASERNDSKLELQNEAFVAAIQYADFGRFESVVDDLRFGVYSPSGTLILGSGPAVADAAVRTALSGTPAVVRTSTSQIAAEPIPDGSALRAESSIAASNREASIALMRLGVIAAAILIVAVIVAFRLSRRMNRPLVALAGSATRLGNGDFSGASTHSGIAEIDAVAAALNGAATDLGTLVENERQLTAHTSHQLRTPLAGMRIAIEAEMTAPRADGRMIFTELLAATRRMDVAIDELISLRREPSSGGETTDLGEVVTTAIETRWSKAFARLDRTVRVAVPPTTIGTRIRRTAIDTVLDVLLANAIEHGRGDVRVSITSPATEAGACIVVADEGRIGCDDPFVRDLGLRRGLGLQLARSVAEADGGTLRMTGADPTTFTFSTVAAASLPAGRARTRRQL